MTLIQHLLSSTRIPLRASSKTQFSCGHTGDIPFTVRVLGSDCTFEKSPKCLACAEAYLNNFSTLCARCRRPIFPGGTICCDGDDQFPFTHAGTCGDAAGFCGHWGEGFPVRSDRPPPD